MMYKIFEYEGRRYGRINKSEARTRINNGHATYISKMNAFTERHLTAIPVYEPQGILFDEFVEKWCKENDVANNASHYPMFWKRLGQL